jgi:hypothetical protein
MSGRDTLRLICISPASTTASGVRYNAVAQPAGRVTDEDRLSGIEGYWRKRMLTDRETPPPVKASDDEVIAHTQKNKGGVGYVSARAALPSTVKVVQVVE